MLIIVKGNDNYKWTRLVILVLAMNTCSAMEMYSYDYGSQVFSAWFANVKAIKCSTHKVCQISTTAIVLSMKEYLNPTADIVLEGWRNPWTPSPTFLGQKNHWAIAKPVAMTNLCDMPSVGFGCSLATRNCDPGDEWLSVNSNCGLEVRIIIWLGQSRSGAPRSQTWSSLH